MFHVTTSWVTFRKTSRPNNAQYLPSNRTRYTGGYVRRDRARMTRAIACGFYLDGRHPPCVANVCPSIMATITRSVHSIRFFLCLPRLFHPSVLATVLGDRCAYALYVVLTLFYSWVTGIHPGIFIRSEGFEGTKKVLSRPGVMRITRVIARVWPTKKITLLSYLIFSSAKLIINYICNMEYLILILRKAGVLLFFWSWLY